MCALTDFIIIKILSYAKPVISVAVLAAILQIQAVWVVIKIHIFKAKPVLNNVMKACISNLKLITLAWIVKIVCFITKGTV